MSSLCTHAHITPNSNAESGSLMLPSLSANIQTTQKIISDLFWTIWGCCRPHVTVIRWKPCKLNLRRLFLTSVEGLHSLFWHERFFIQQLWCDSPAQTSFSLTWFSWPDDRTSRFCLRVCEGGKEEKTAWDREVGLKRGENGKSYSSEKLVEARWAIEVAILKFYQQKDGARIQGQREGGREQ